MFLATYMISLACFNGIIYEHDLESGLMFVTQSKYACAGADDAMSFEDECDAKDTIVFICQ